MAFEKIRPPDRNQVQDPELLRRCLHDICYEMNRELIVDKNYNLVSLSGWATPTPTTYGGGSILYAGFVHTVDKDVCGSIELPHGTRLTTITPHIHWFPSTTGTGNVKWDLAYTVVQIGGTEPAETTISVTDTADGTAGENMFAAFDPIDISALSTPNTQFSFCLSRDVSVASNYGAAALAKTFGLHVTMVAVGSRAVDQL